MMICYIAKDQPQYKANLHSHSVISDGRLTPEKMKDEYKKRGYSILAITDHEIPYDHSDMTEPDFLMITGYESHIRPNGSNYDAYGPEIHINLIAKDPHNVTHINFNDDYCKCDPEIMAKSKKAGSMAPRQYTVEYINEFVKTAVENGYLCAHNHAVWSHENQEQVAQYKGFFSMEMCNYGSYHGNRIEYNAVLYDRMLREGNRIFVHSADDNHNGAPLDSPASDSFGAFTMVLAKDLTYGSVIDALEKGNFYSSMGPRINELTFDGDSVHIETDPVRQITMHTAGKVVRYKVGTESEPVTFADFKIPEQTPYVRFSAYDFCGRYADTRGFFRDELSLE